MSESLILPGLDNNIDGLFVIEFSGSDSNLKSHRIDIGYYVKSLSGYQSFASSVGKVLYKTDIELFVTAELDGSFKSILKAVGGVVGTVSSLMGILSFFNISARDLPEAFIKTKAAIVETIKENYGDMQRITEKINKSKRISDEEKLLLLNLFTNEDFRESLDNFTSPLDSTGYNSIRIIKNNETLTNITSQERKYFIFITPGDEKIEYFSDLVEIIYISPELTRWQFKGKEVFWADVLDEKFLITTKNKKSSELRGVKYFATGRKISSRKPGGKNWTTKWYIDSIVEESRQELLVQKP